MQRGIEQLRRLEERVAVHHPEAHEFGVLQAGDHPQHAFLLAPLEVGLEAHQVPEAAVFVFLAQLHHRIGALGAAHIAVVHIAPARIPEADRLEGPVAHRVFAAAGELFNRQAALEEGGVLLFEILEFGLLCSQQRLAEGEELLFVHRAVDVIGVALVVAGGAEGHAQINALALHDRAGGIKEVAVGAAGEGAQLLG